MCSNGGVLLSALSILGAKGVAARMGGAGAGSSSASGFV